MEKIYNGKHEFEVVESVPVGYQIWNVGVNMIDGYLPLVQLVNIESIGMYGVNTNTMKAIKVDEAQIILKALGRGQGTIKKMERYIKRYKNSKTEITQRHVNRLREALKVMYTIKGIENLI